MSNTRTFVYRWSHTETDIEFSMTSEDMEIAYNAIGLYPEDLAATLTGLNTDSYADLCEELDMQDTMDDDYQLCMAYHRLLNVTNPDDSMCECNFRQG